MQHIAFSNPKLRITPDNEHMNIIQRILKNVWMLASMKISLIIEKSNKIVECLKLKLSKFNLKNKVF